MRHRVAAQGWPQRRGDTHTLDHSQKFLQSGIMSDQVGWQRDLSRRVANSEVERPVGLNPTPTAKEGGAGWSASGPENRAKVTLEGSTPSPSARCCSHLETGDFPDFPNERSHILGTGTASERDYDEGEVEWAVLDSDGEFAVVPERRKVGFK